MLVMLYALEPLKQGTSASGVRDCPVAAGAANSAALGETEELTSQRLYRRNMSARCRRDRPG